VLGYTFLGLLAFRLLWGVAGSRYARFRSFLYGPRAVITYLQSLLARRPIHYVGHNPAGSWAIYAILILGVAVGVSGYAVHIDAGGRWLESLHEGVSNVLLALVVIHVAGVIVGSFAHRENLVAAMLTGYKSGQPSEAIRGTRWATAAALIAVVAASWTGVVGIGAGFAPDAKATTTDEHRRSHHSHHGANDRDD
jgi:cytochrome b